MGKGGKRPGSGRPAKDYAALSVTLPREARNEIRDISLELGIPQGEVINFLLQEYKEHMDK